MPLRTATDQASAVLFGGQSLPCSGTLLVSGDYTTDAAPVEFTPPRGAISLVVTLNITTITSATLTAYIDGWDPASSTWVNILTSAGKTSTGTTSLTVSPYMTAVTNLTAQSPLYETMRLRTLGTDTPAALPYSASANFTGYGSETLVSPASDGAGLITVLDSAGHFIATDVEGVLAEGAIGHLGGTSAGWLAAAKVHASSAYMVKGVDLTDNCIFCRDDTGSYIRQSTDWGATWSASKGEPTNVTHSTITKFVRFGAYIYVLAKDSSDNLYKVWRASPASGDTAFTWSSPLHAMASTGATALGSSLSASSSYLYLAEYGSPTGGPAAYRSANGTDWTTIYTADATLTHIHAIAEDPYNAGHVWMTCGDGTAKTIQRSTDYGDTWSVVVASSAWQGVQISFSPEWVFVAGDGSRGTVVVVDRDTGTPYWGSTNFHWNVAVPGAATVTDKYWKNAYFGAVDPATGIYYCVANDTSASGTTMGLFWLPRVGSSLQILDPGGNGISMNGEVHIGVGWLFSNLWRKALLS